MTCNKPAQSFKLYMYSPLPSPPSGSLCLFPHSLCRPGPWCLKPWRVSFLSPAFTKSHSVSLPSLQQISWRATLSTSRHHLWALSLSPNCFSPNFKVVSILKMLISCLCQLVCPLLFYPNLLVILLPNHLVPHFSTVQ